MSAVVRSEPTAASPALGPQVPLAAGISAIASGQLSRVRVARIPLLFVATVQSIGLVVLLRGVVHRHDATTAAAVVAGTSVLVVAFVALNMLAQRFGGLRASGALDYYAALPVSPTAVVLGTAVAYATFTIPGALLTAVLGTAIYGIAFAHVWVVVPAIVVAAPALAGVGALIGLALPRPEFATVAGQLAMTAVLFLGIIPASHFPVVVRGLRDIVPGALAIDGFADALQPATHWAHVFVLFAITAAYGVVALWLATRTFRRAVAR